VSLPGFRGGYAALLAFAVFASASARAELPAPARRSAPIQLAVTVDDLPAVGAGTPAWSKAQVLRAIIGTLVLHHVPEPVGFFNGSNMDDDPRTEAALRDWIEAGFLIGNHTFSHESADEVPPAAFERDIERDQDVIGALDPAARRGTRYFRYPYLDRGSPKDDVQIRRFLSDHHYRIADVSVDFEDWAFSAAYARCSEHGDQAALASLAQSYLDYALAALFWSVDSAQRLLGRAVPQVLLIHADLFTAQKLDELLDAYEAAGVHFVSLSHALADPVYRNAENAHHGDTSLVRALSRERHKPLRTFVPVPIALLDALCREPVAATLPAPAEPEDAASAASPP
jgi:peptidoglycan/xylan/chitin deacetylase (PgdA/CDA1 family)